MSNDRPENHEQRPMLRVAVIGTPRSGNSWVRVALRLLYGLEEFTAHHASEIDGDKLPRRCVIQIHWPPTPEFVAMLEREGVRVVVPARHASSTISRDPTQSSRAALPWGVSLRKVANPNAVTMPNGTLM